MAYFSALGGTGGTSATITVTYSEDFYGLTITATNGTTTLTKTATSSGTLVFDVSEGGTWVVSGTVEGATYSESVDVTFEYTAPPLVALPDGSTALPVNDIQMWLKCAAIRDKTTYTTLSDVLGDTETFIALCADSNACDYMARSTTWASGVAADSTAMLIVGKYNYCANKLLSNSTWNSAIRNSTYWESVLKSLIPTMTGYTTPSGEVIYNGTPQNNYLPWHAFNSDGTSGQVNIGQNVYLGYGFEEPKQINKMYFYYIHFSITSNPNAVIQIIASDDKTTWEVLKDNISVTVSGYTTTFEFDNNTAYKYYAVRLKSYSAGSSFGWFYCEMYGRTDNANYIPLVPKMTSNTTPSGECLTSTAQTNFPAYYAFDNNDSTKWRGSTGANEYIGYHFDAPKVVTKVKFKSENDSVIRLKNYEIRGSNDRFTTYDTLASGTYANNVHEEVVILNNTTAYSDYCLFVIDHYSTSAYGISVVSLQFYSKQAYTLIHSAVEDNIFYMDDGSPVALCGIPVGDTIDVDLEAYKGQTLTLVSTVAKDPTNLSNDFSMNVRITPNITEIYLMPNKALYWYGYNGGIEAINSTNGWTWAATSATQVQPTFNNNNITITTTTSTFGGVGTSSVVDSGSKVHSITNTTGTGRIGLCEGKTNNTTPGSTTTSTGTSHTVLEVSFTSKYCTAYSVKVANTMRIDAFWYE